MRQIIIDTETTGLSPAEGHRIIEIGCVELVNRRITGRQYHQYLNPERDIESDAQAVHGITLEFLQDKPVFASIATEFLAFIKGAELIIHNAPFDVGFIEHEFGMLSGRWKKVSDICQITDTLILARTNHPGQRNNLDALCKRYAVDNTRRELHGALLDAHLLAQVYLAMTGGQASLFDMSSASEMEAAGLQVVEEDVAIPSVALERVPLRVIRASEEELALHQKKLADMRTKGKCLWEENL